MQWKWMAGFVALYASWAHADACHDALAAFDYSRAGQLAQSGMNSMPADPAARMCAARAAYETGRFSDALLHLRVVESQHPQAELRTYAYNWLTVTLRKLGREQEAMQYGQAALASARRESSQQNLATALHNLGGLVYARGNTLKDAVQSPLEGYADPLRTKAPQGGMESYAATAVALYKESIPLNPDLSERSASFNNVGLILQAQGQHAVRNLAARGDSAQSGAVPFSSPG